MSHEDQLRNPEYKRWLRGCLGFKYSSEGIIDTVDEEIKQHHTHLLNNLSVSRCNQCKINELLPTHKKTKNKCPRNRKKCFCVLHSQNGRTCPNSFCGEIYDKIVDFHRFHDPNWTNTDITKWEDYLEVAKCFINTSGYSDKKKIHAVDCSGLLSMVINNSWFDRSLTKAGHVNTQAGPADRLQLFKQVRDNRNVVFHEAKMELTEKQLEDLIYSMISILDLPEIKDKQQCIEKLKKLLDQDLFISLEDELAIRQETFKQLKEIHHECLSEAEEKRKCVVEEIQSLTTKCRTECEQMLERNQEKTEENRKQLQTDFKLPIVKLEQMCKSLQDNQLVALSSIENIETDLAQLTAQINKQAQKEVMIESVFQELKNTVKEFMKTTSKNEHHAVDLENDQNAIDYLEKKKKTQALFCNYYRDCLSRIPVSPVMQKIAGSVDEVFVELEIFENIEHMQEKRGKRIEKYKDMLVKNDNIPCKDIILVGDAGMGKTTWCKKFLNTWINSACPNDSCDKVSDEKDDVDALKPYQLLIFIALRDQSRFTTVIDMIKEHPLVKEHCLQDTIVNVLKSQPNTCLILLDGLDEWTPKARELPFPGRDCLFGCPIITTTRPYRIVGMPDSFHPDIVVKMFGVRDQVLLIKNVIRKLNNTKQISDFSNGDKDVKRDHTDYIQKMKGLKDRDESFRDKLPAHLQVPLILVFSVCSWFHKGTVGNTLTENMIDMVEFLLNYAQGIPVTKLHGIGEPTKLSNIKGLDKFKESWKKGALLLPSRLRKYRTICDFSGLLIKVSKLAFMACFNKGSNVQLVFEHSELLEYLSNKELEIVLKVGILSQSEGSTTVLNPVTTVSFLHKALQECFAGLYIVVQYKIDFQSIQDLIESSYRNHKKMIDIDNAIIFACAFDPECASNISKSVFESIPIDVYSKHQNYFTKLCLRQVQVIHTNFEDYPWVEYPIYSETVFVPEETMSALGMKNLRILVETNWKHFKSLHLPARKAIEIVEVLSDTYLQASGSLERRLTVYGINKENPVPNIGQICSKWPCFQSIVLEERKEEAARCSAVLIDISECKNIKRIILRNFSNLELISDDIVQLFEKPNYELENIGCCKMNLKQI